ncbi:hypothetical protein [Amycolatopsis regifaucium]|uniref:Lipoprotein n=1 Tax=Amycolatopsis regifaucium TaxID=546365 RepID=A0A154MIZ1_9PSEU|nr:hypothetical protein [Amycolatopsis regifaucium]KZB84398.1 hypothetical protein AVL48_31870 [Amycolatopsis regifaucium]OKA10861.1 hypothetical protein ATP06_0201535 [Amycolatopsis regifaucium]SFI20216.1 hypothetical protein SAMN04489731_10951 [Amycolatopsis regifaucium]
MKNAAKTLGAGLVLAATAACGAGGPGAPANTSTPPVVTTPSALPTSLPASPPVAKPPMSRPTAGPPPSDAMLPPSQVEAKVPAQVSAGTGTTLNVHVEISGCDEATANLAEQNARRVVVKIKIDHGDPGRMCPQVIRYVVLPVRPAEPIGSRTVVLEGS